MTTPFTTATKNELLILYTKFYDNLKNNSLFTPMKFTHKIEIKKNDILREKLHEELMFELNRKYTEIKQGIKNLKLIHMFVQIQRKITKTDGYIEAREGLTLDTRELRWFIKENKNFIDPKFFTPVLGLLHQLSLNDQKYFMKVHYITNIPKALINNSTRAETNNRIFKLDNNNEESCKIQCAFM